MSKIFYVDTKERIEISYEKLFKELSQTDNYNKYCLSDSYYSIFKHILISIILGKEIVLLDQDFSKAEIKRLIGDYELLCQSEKVLLPKIISYENIIEIIANRKNTWKLTLFSSGTTGLPKKISHNYSTLLRFIKTEDDRRKDIWGFAYNPTHMAGLQVFFQAFMNKNTLIRLFGISRSNIFSLINEYGITNISSTPTFYKLLLPNDHICESVRNISSGGEKFDSKVFNHLQGLFPNSRIRNIYASTEAGSLFSAIGDEFSIKSEFQNLVKIVEDEVFIHHSLLGQSNDIRLNTEGWYQSGDFVTITCLNPIRFKFSSRRNDIINTGGYKVDPYEVEEELSQIPGIVNTIVYGKKNSLLGSIVACDIICKDQLITEKHIRNLLKVKLQEYKIPRIINFVDRIDTTRTGKVLRK